MLSARERNILAALRRLPGRVITKEQLCRELKLTTRQLDEAALGSALQAEGVRNIWGVGYRLEDA